MPKTMKFWAWFETSGMTQTELADKLGCSKATITKWKKGSVPNFDLRLKVAELSNGIVSMKDGW